MFIEDLSYFIGLECQVTTTDSQIFRGELVVDQGKIVILDGRGKPEITLDPADVYQVRNLKS